MKKIYFIILVLFCFAKSQASDSLYVQFNKTNFNKGDTIQMNCNWNEVGQDYKNITLNLILENTNKKSRTQFRYPLINGQAFANIIIGEDIPDGNYAVHLLLQKAFPQINGYTKKTSSKVKDLSYMMLLKNKPAYIGSVHVDENGKFKTPKFTFADTAYFIFFEIGNKHSEIDLGIENAIDSIYIPIIGKHTYLQIGASATVADTNYQFDLHEKIENKKNTLSTVIVNSKIKKRIEQFDEQYSTGMFQGGFPTIFDGIDEESIARSFDLFTFLQTRVPGLTKKTNEMGTTMLYWRNQAINIYIDEFKVEDEFVGMLNLSNIAMVKVFPPLSGGPSNNGAIAIYTKRGVYELPSKRKFNFLVKGFTPSESYWHL